MRFSRSTEAVSKPFGGETARGKHLFPFRTEPLSLSAPMVLGGQPPGRVGRRRFFQGPPLVAALFLLCRFAVASFESLPAAVSVPLSQLACCALTRQRKARLDRSNHPRNPRRLPGAGDHA